MPTLKQLEDQGRALAQKQLDLANDDSRPWSARKKEFDQVESDIKEVLKQHRALKDLDQASQFGTGALGSLADGVTSTQHDIAGKNVANSRMWAQKGAQALSALTRDAGTKAVVSGSVTMPAVVVMPGGEGWQVDTKTGLRNLRGGSFLLHLILKGKQP